MIKGVAFGSAGVRGIAFLPVIESWEKQGVFRTATHFAATSAGCFFALPLALGAPAKYIRDKYEETDWSTFSKFGGLEAIRRLGTRSLKYPTQWIKTVLDDFGFDESLTFKQLLDETGSSLFLTATNETITSTHVFSPSTSPDVKVMDAMLASMAIQYYYPLVKIGDHEFSDGGLALAYPIDILEDEGLLPVELLGVKIEEKLEPIKLTGFWAWFKRAWRLLTLARAIANKKHISTELWDRTVKVEVSGVSATKFDLSKDEKGYLISRGEVAVTEVSL